MTSVIFPRAVPTARRANALYCATAGAGLPLLLLHAFGEDGTVFAPVLPAYAALGYAMVPDLRGHGQSRTLTSSGDTARHAADLINLLDLLRVERCVVLARGSSAGIAQQLAAAGRVCGMILPAPRRSAPLLGRLARLAPNRRDAEPPCPTLMLETMPASAEQVQHQIGRWLATQVRAC